MSCGRDTMRLSYMVQSNLRPKRHQRDTLLLPPTTNMKKSSLMAPFRALARGVTGIIQLLFGRLSWQPPPWLRWLFTHPRTTLITLVILVLLASGGRYGWQWYSHLPKPHTVKYVLYPPENTDYKTTPPKINPLLIRFNESVAPLLLVGKTVTTGVRIDPALDGTWRWADDRSLVFLPKEDWPIATRYNVIFSEKHFFAPGVLLKQYEYPFSSAAFFATINNTVINQDPLDPTIKRMTATVTFSHPVNAASLSGNIQLQLEKGLQYQNANKVNPDIKVAKDGMKVYVTSAPLAVPLESVPITLTLGKKISASRGNAPLQNEPSASIKVPGRYQLQFSDIQISYINNTQGEPQQVLMLSSSFPLTDEMIAKHVRAWLLPEDRQIGSLDKLKESDLQDEISLTQIPSAEPLNTLHSFKMNIPGERQLVVKVDNQIESVGGYLLKDPFFSFLGSGNYPKVVKFMGNGALLSLRGERKLGVMAQGVPGVKVEIARILPGQLHQLVGQNGSRFGNPEVYDQDFDRMVERASFTRNFEKIDPSKPIYDFVDLSSYLQYNGGRRGIFVLRIRPYDANEPKQKEGDYVYDKEDGDRRLIVVTDLGIITKKTLDGGREVFVQSMSTGLPLAGVDVSIAGRNGLSLAEKPTDSEGHVRFEQLGDLTREKTPLMLVATLGEDQSFLPLEDPMSGSELRLDFSRYDIGGEDNKTSPDQLTGTLFTDRGMYRPGETAHIAYILRTADWARSIAGVPVEIEITNPEGMAVSKERQAVNASGFETIDYTPGENAPTGTYTASVYLIKNNERTTLLGSTDFTVREFEPDRLKVDLRLSDTPSLGWLMPQQVKPVVTARHLFGANASDRRVTADMELLPSFPAFSQYPDYRFYLDGTQQGYEETTLGDAQTGPDGTAVLNPNLQRYSARVYRLRLTARVYETKGGRSVAANQETLVASVPYLIGVRSKDPLDYVTKGAKRNCHWLALTPNLDPTTADNLTLSLFEYRYVSVLVKQENGTFAYESRRKAIAHGSQPLNLGKEGAETELPTSEPGDFAYELTDSKGTLLNKISWTVAGIGNLSRSLERNAELQIKLDKKSYSPGETIQINIRAPYTGSGLITIERDKVYAHHWFTTKTTSSVQTITVPEGIEGNGYINVQFLRDPNSAEIFMSPLSSGVAPFAVSLSARTLPMNLTSPQLVEPGQTVEMHLSSDEPAKAVLFAVDEGILQVARYKTPDPLGKFFAKRSLDVETAQILSLILPEFSQMIAAAAPGGGGEDDALAAHLNPFKRKRKGPVAYWSGMVDLPAGGRAFTYQVPDSFNGRLRIIAIAVTSQRIGVAATNTEVRGPWVLTPNTPPFIAPGDEFTVTVGAFNNSKDTSVVQLSLKTDAGCVIKDEASVSTEVAPGRESMAEFHLKATERLGSSQLVFTAQSPRGTARISETLSVRPATPYRNNLRAGSSTETSLSLQRQRDLIDEYGQVYLGVARSPLVWAQGLSTYLEHYPYECTEQLLSKAMPALILGNTNVAGIAQPANKQIDQAFSLLRQRQNSSGGFGQWDGNAVVQPEMSAYAADFLIEASERGYSIPSDLQEHSLSYLQELANGPASSLPELRIKARAVYLLTRLGQVTTAPLSATLEQLKEYHDTTWKNDLAAAYLGASQILLKQTKQGEQLLGSVPWAALASQQVETDGSLYGDDLSHDAELLTLMSRYAPEKAAKLPPKLLTVLGNKLSANRYSSLSAALLIRAFADYTQSMQNKGNELSVELGLPDKSIRPLQLQLVKGSAEDKLPLNWDKVILRQPSAGMPFYYQLTEAGFDRKPPAEKISQGIEITRSYVDDQGKELSQMQVGQEYTVRLRLRATEADQINEIAIVDLLPGGLEPVMPPPSNNDEVETQDTESQNDDNTPDNENQAETVAPAPEAQSDSDWSPDFTNIRDDRVVLYGSLTRDVITYTYKVRAINAGTYHVPAAYAEGMYDRALQGRDEGGMLTIVEP